MNPEIQQLKSKIAELKSFLDKGEFTEYEIINWVSDCVAFFSIIKVNESVIASFLKVFENHIPKERKEAFQHDFSRQMRGEDPSMDVYYFGPFWKHSRDSKYTSFLRGGSFLYLDVGLKTAEEIINAKEEAERLIPVSLIKIFDMEKTQNIKAALESIESNYQARDSRGMISPLVTVTTELLNLVLESDQSKNIGPRLQSLYEQKAIHEKYSLNKDIVWALNSSRIIRNEEVDHQKKEHLGNVPMYEATGCGHLLVLFMNSLLASGQIILE